MGYWGCPDTTYIMMTPFFSQHVFPSLSVAWCSFLSVAGFHLDQAVGRTVAPQLCLLSLSSSLAVRLLRYSHFCLPLFFFFSFSQLLFVLWLAEELQRAEHSVILANPNA